MSKWRKNPAVDKNQPEIVKALRSIPGVTVQTGMDDILCGYKGVTFWFELKTPDKRKENGDWQAHALRQSQIDLLNDWRGQYNVVCTLEEILQIIGIHGR